MFAIVCRRRLWIPPKGSIFLGPQFLDPQCAVFAKLFSSKISSSPGVCRNDSEKSFTASYLISSYGLSSQDALSLSEKVQIKSSKNPDAVLELFRKYGFTNADIIRLVSRWPPVLKVRPEKTLLPKLEFFSSIDIPLPVLAEILSFNPLILRRSLKNSIIPWYNYLKSFVRSDERRLRVLSQSTKGVFKSIPSKISLLREEGLPESSIGHLLSWKPWMIRTRKEKIAACIHRAAEMGIDKNKSAFAQAIEVFLELSESTLKHKMEVYRRCGWSESDLNVAFPRFPLCMKLSEKKITANMEFLVNEMGLEPVAVARNPTVIGLSLEKRMKPRYLVAKMLYEKGLKKMPAALSLLVQSKELFLKIFIVPYQCDIPKLLDIYQGRLSECAETGSSQEEIEKT